MRNGATEEYRVNSGSSTVECKIDWCGSKSFTVDLQKDETAYLKVRSGMKFYFLFVMLLAVGVFLIFFYRSNPGKPSWVSPASLFLIIPAALYSLYYLTIGRKDYLVVEKDTKNVFA